MHPFLTGNALKLIAALSMTIDHAGLLLFPQYPVLRILGRLAFPIFAFMIAQGCKYTHSRRRYFGNIFALAVLCQSVYYLVDGSLYLSILFTFSLSILTIFALQDFRREPTALRGAVFFGAVAMVYVLNRIFSIDYGFWGCMVPVFAALPQNTKWDTTVVSTLLLGLGLVFLGLHYGGDQMYALAAIPLLLCYNGQRGKWKMKSFFYIFYPAHLVVLQLIAWLVWG